MATFHRLQPKRLHFYAHWILFMGSTQNPPQTSPKQDDQTKALDWIQLWNHQRECWVFFFQIKGWIFHWNRKPFLFLFFWGYEHQKLFSFLHKKNKFMNKHWSLSLLLQLNIILFFPLEKMFLFTDDREIKRMSPLGFRLLSWKVPQGR